jgi:hypothetical protein
MKVHRGQLRVRGLAADVCRVADAILIVVFS